MQSQKIHNEKLNSGISSVAGSPRGAIKNLILKNEGAYKRQGHMPLVTLTDEELSPLKINGIFDFAYLDEEKSQACKIVHAKNRLFRLNEDFSALLEIPLGNFSIRDEKTKGFVNDGKLFIIGGGDILIYDGTKIYSAYKSEGAYIPTTTVGITDQYNGMQGEVKESYNLLTPRRKNTFIGSNARREKGTACKFLLDEKIKYGTKIILEVKIRTSVSESELDEATTSYIGIDKNGNEVSRIVTLRYERENISPDDTMLLIEPPRDEAGNEIKIKIGDKIPRLQAQLKDLKEINERLALESGYIAKMISLGFSQSKQIIASGNGKKINRLLKECTLISQKSQALTKELDLLEKIDTDKAILSEEQV